MTNIVSTARRFVFAAAAFGLATTALAGAARADSTVAASATLRIGADVDVRDHRTPTRHERRDRYDQDGRHDRHDQDGRHDRYDQDGRHDRYQPRPTRPIFVDPYYRAFARYDWNHNRRIDVSERKAYWGYVLSTGTYGQLTSDESSRFIQLIGYYDLDADGRLLGSERAGMNKLIDSLRLFHRLDRNGDKVLSSYEVGFSVFAPRFYFIDRNRDRRISQQEVRDDALRAFRDGEIG